MHQDPELHEQVGAHRPLVGREPETALTAEATETDVRLPGTAAIGPAFWRSASFRKASPRKPDLSQKQISAPCCFACFEILR
jgi:hypothetical protein